MNRSISPDYPFLACPLDKSSIPTLHMHHFAKVQYVRRIIPSALFRRDITN